MLSTQHPPVFVSHSNEAVSDDAAIRRANLRALCKKRGWTAKDLPGEMGWGRYTYWRDLIEDPTKSFGEKAARHIEETLQLGRGWLDEPGAADVTRYPRATERAPAAREPPPAPPAGFRDRRVVNESDWDLLQDVKDGATPEELEKIRERANVLRNRVDEMMAERMAIAAAAPGRPPPPPKNGR